MLDRIITTDTRIQVSHSIPIQCIFKTVSVTSNNTKHEIGDTCKLSVTALISHSEGKAIYGQIISKEPFRNSYFSSVLLYMCIVVYVNVNNPAVPQAQPQAQTPTSVES